MRNLTAALACGFALDIPGQRCWNSHHAALPEGRMEIVCRQPVLAVVIMRTASALEAMLKHWRKVADQRHTRLSVVFGCGEGPGRRINAR